jgi:outer membrane protein assembly factor BamB
VETGSRRGLVAALTPAGERLWEQSFTQPVDASPLVGPDGTIYVGGVDGNFYALRPGVNETRIKWTVRTGGFVSSSAALSPDGATLYVGSGDGRLYAISTDGAVRWSFPSGAAIWGSPAVGGDGTIFFGSTDRAVYALRPDGTERWRFATGGQIYASPAIGSDGTVYIGSNDQRFYAIQENGTKRWEYFTNGPIDASAAVGADGTIYVPSSDGNFYAFNPSARDQEPPRWISRIGVTTISSPAVRGDGLIVYGGDDNVVRALDPVTGSIRWTFAADQSASDDGIESSPLVAPDGAIYVGSLDGNLYKIAGNGSPLSAAASWPAFQAGVMRQGRAARATGGGRLVNLATRAAVPGDRTLIVGFFVEATALRAHLVRAVGPTLAAFGLAGFMPDPRLQLYSGSTALPRGANDNWSEPIGADLTFNFGIADASEAVGAFALPAGSRDAAVLLPLASGLYSAHASSADGRGGVVLVEAYDAIAGEPARLMNLSTRSMAGSGENALIAGFVVGGTGPTRLLLRGVGPGLAQFGVTDSLARPVLSLFAQASAGGTPRLLATNSGWTSGGLAYDKSSTAARVSAFALPNGSADSAMVVTVDPGPYTTQIASADGGTGEALVEIYVLP